MKKKYANVIRSVFLLVITAENIGCSMVGIRSVEEALYTVQIKDEDKEIREYSPRIVARTTVGGQYKQAQRETFRILADYIFGNNSASQEIAMTAPVTQKQESDQIAMTAPVTQEKSGEGWTMSFAMPGKFKNISEIPKPIDQRIELVQKPASIYAAIRFSWLTDEERNREKSLELIEWLQEKKQYQAISGPIYAGYDPPWTLPFFRRQEMIVEVKPVTK